MIDINLTGVWLCMKYELPHMLKQGSGAIVNTASGAGLIGVAGMSAYVASKHGVVGLTKTAALEYAKSGIRVNSVCPGLIQTPMVERLTADQPQLGEALVAAEPVGRTGKPEEIAESVVWLSSDAASFVTGHAMSVDGGFCGPITLCLPCPAPSPLEACPEPVEGEGARVGGKWQTETLRNIAKSAGRMSRA